MTKQTRRKTRALARDSAQEVAPEPYANLLIAPLLGVRLSDHDCTELTLPGVLATLSTGDIAAFTALQAHQGHAWHAFLVQLAAIAVERAGIETPPPDEARWAVLLRGLTDGRDEPWCLVVPDLARPAFMQPPVPEESLDRFKEPVWYPDAVDVLVTSKNHDVKRARMARPRSEHWMYALVSLQTTGGFSGRDNYGIARMNGGFGSRPGVGFAPGFSHGARFRRDLSIAVQARAALGASDFGYPARGGLALLWLEPWEGTRSLELRACDPLFIEVCRRVRLVLEAGRLGVRTAPSKVPRLAASVHKGDTGDPWVPVKVKDGAALTVSPAGFTYDLTQRLLLGAGDFTPGAAGRLTESDPDGTLFVATVLARGQGETNGFHDRRVPIPKRVRRMLGRPDSRDHLSLLAQRRVERAAAARRHVLHPALCALLQAGAERLDFRDDRTGRWTRALDREIDRDFFDQLWADAETDDQTADTHWVQTLRRLARAQIDDAIEAAPVPVARRYRAIAAAERVFEGACRKHLDIPLTEVSTT